MKKNQKNKKSNQLSKYIAINKQTDKIKNHKIECTQPKKQKPIRHTVNSTREDMVKNPAQKED